MVSVQTLHVETLKTDIRSEHQTRKEPTSGSFYQISLLFSTSSSDNPFIKPGWRMSSRGALRRRWRRSRRGGVVKDGGDLGQCGEKAVSCWKSPLWPSFPLLCFTSETYERWHWFMPGMLGNLHSWRVPTEMTLSKGSDGEKCPRSELLVNLEKEQSRAWFNLRANS